MGPRPDPHPPTRTSQLQDSEAITSKTPETSQIYLCSNPQPGRRGGGRRGGGRFPLQTVRNDNISPYQLPAEN
ncbi:hypothetical protein CesoFtcFv8_003036 [Champsocephalus esox]|uniref:Uncharacterized protein n=1 Tax=Champsocephalus esox TaxID=159716 RepID=A0AAN8HEZ7_9TELE|nr:hypothetical protein CesoFtcFv8_003036 [Champsocephalus esox]